MPKKIILILLAVLIISGFSKTPELQDFRDISQDHRTFTEMRAHEFSRLDKDLQIKADAFHNMMFFSPWHRTESQFTREEITFEFDKYGKSPGYGKGGKRHTPQWIKGLRANAQLDLYPRAVFPAITIQNSDLRVLPTDDIHVMYPKNTSLPFDNLQNSGVAGNTPLFVSHVTKDKLWVLAETYYAMGWIRASHIAPVDGAFITQWEHGAYATIIKDKTPIRDSGGRLLFKAPLGVFFPKMTEDGKGIHILVAMADSRGTARMEQVVLPNRAAAAKPLALTAENMTMLANQLMNEPYGWGGLGGRRDCSSTLMDLFAPFGIWLPRNSNHQAHETGAFIELQNRTPEEKERIIMQQGIPYFTLLWLKGHIMLYIGSKDGHPLVFHNFWSVRTMDAQGNRGKKIIGRAAITTLHPGRELSQGKGAGNLLPHILGMALLWPPSTGIVNGVSSDKDSPSDSDLLP